MGEGFRCMSTRPGEGCFGQGGAVQEGRYPDPTLEIFVIITFRAASIFVQQVLEGWSGPSMQTVVIEGHCSKKL